MSGYLTDLGMLNKSVCLLIKVIRNQATSAGRFAWFGPFLTGWKQLKKEMADTPMITYT